MSIYKNHIEPHQFSDRLKWYKTQFQFSRSVMSDSCDPMNHSSPPCPSLTPGVYSNSHPSSRWCHPAISSSSSPSPPAPNPSQHQGHFQWVNSSHEVAKVLEFQLQSPVSVHRIYIQNWSPLGWTGWMSLRDSQESSPTPQVKSFNSLDLSFLYSPTLTSIHDHFSECWALSQLFHSPLSFSSSSLSAIRVVICISEVIDISPSNLDSSLCFFHPSVSHDVLCI